MYSTKKTRQFTHEDKQEAIQLSFEAIKRFQAFLTNDDLSTLLSIAERIIRTGKSNAR